jgi:hypothetical protein
MATLALEVNDAGLLALRAGSMGLRRREGGPGMALFEGSRLLVGEEARARSRLLPRLTTSRFWDELDTTLLGRPFPDGVTAADLAHAQLKAFWDGAERGVREVILAVPGYWSERSLGVLLGIAGAIGMPIVGMVDAGVAAASDRPGRRMLHLDLTLHRAVATELGRVDGAGGAEVARGRVESVALGLYGLREALAHGIAEAFVRQTRFDPLHDAGTEQALYDALDAFVVRLRDEGEATLALLAGRRTHEVRITRESAVGWTDAALQALGDVLRRVVGPDPDLAEVLLSPRAALWPGLARRIGEEYGLSPLELPVDAAVEGALRAHAHIRSTTDSDALPFQTRLPIAGAPGLPEPRPSERPFATHLVRDGLTWPIGHEPIVLGEGPTIRLLTVEGRSLIEVEDGARVSLNGRDLAGGAPLRAGDRLRVAGRELLLIAMAPPGGAGGSA